MTGTVSQPQSQPQNRVAPRELARRLAEGNPLELLDVRTPGEFAAVRVPGARLIPLGDLNAADYLRQRTTSRPIYVLCQSGGRARKAIELFQRAGCHECVLVAGGTQAWLEAGLPVERSESRGLPLMRQVQIVVGFISAIGATLALTVNPWFAALPLIMGTGLSIAGLTGFCGLAHLLARMRWNRAAKLGAGH